MFRPKRLRTPSYEMLSVKVKADLQDCYLDCHNVRELPHGGLAALGRFDEVALEQKVKKAAFADKGKIYFVTPEGDGLYVKEGDAVSCVMQGKFEDVFFLSYGSYPLFTSPSTGVFRIVGSEVVKLSLYGFYNMAVSRDIAVLNQRNGVRVAPLDETVNAWTLAHKVPLNEQCSAVVTLGKKVYLLGNDCYAFEPRAYTPDSTLFPVAHNVGFVRAESVVALGNKAVFASDGKLFKLQSEKVSRIFGQLDATVDFHNAVACRLNGYYLVSGQRKLLSGGKNDITLLLDVDRERIAGVFEWGFDSLYSRGEELYAVRDGVLYRFSEEEDLSIFRVSNLDLGTTRIKFLDKFAIRSNCYNYVLVESDGYRVGKYVTGKGSTQFVTVHGHGKQFGIEVQSEDGLDLQYLELFARAPKGV